jgi:hypothetical protein
MMFELVDDTMTYAGNVPEIFSMRDHLFVSQELENTLDVATEINLLDFEDEADLAVA